jgi:hypothetical protein
MPNLTEERFREILEKSFEKHTRQLDDNGYHTAVDEDDFPEMLDDAINHPEIKGLFKCEEDIVKQDVNHPYCPKRKCGMRQQNIEEVCLFCGADLVFPEIEPPAPVAEYEIFEVQQTALETVDPVCEYIGDCAVGCMFCELHCKTNGLQNFAGHEVEGRSIRCAHRFNVGGEG